MPQTPSRSLLLPVYFSLDCSEKNFFSKQNSWMRDDGRAGGVKEPCWTQKRIEKWRSRRALQKIFHPQDSKIFMAFFTKIFFSTPIPLRRVTQNQDYKSTSAELPLSWMNCKRDHTYMIKSLSTREVIQRVKAQKKKKQPLKYHLLQTKCPTQTWLYIASAVCPEF